LRPAETNSTVEKPGLLRDVARGEGIASAVTKGIREKMIDKYGKVNDGS
jgi:hypothetical protein